MAATGAQVVELRLWVQHYEAQAEKLRQSAEVTGRSAWERFTHWYDAAAVAALAAEMADHSQAAQDIAAGLSGQYVANVAAVASGVLSTMPARSDTITIRGGAPLSLVHTRPANTYRRAIAFGATPRTAREKAAVRASDLMRSDVVLVQRQAAQRTLERLGITEYRRILHPEESQSGSCGLCIVAADRKYKTRELMPIHPPSCNCGVMPVVGSWDPGINLNRAQLDKLYSHGGGSAAKDLFKTRYKVAEHGEYGPTLVRAEDQFRGPGKVALEDDPKRAARWLQYAEPVLHRMEADGGPRDELAYQRQLVGRLRRIAGASAAA